MYVYYFNYLTLNGNRIRQNHVSLFRIYAVDTIKNTFIIYSLTYL